jgi:hypothetical protein
VSHQGVKRKGVVIKASEIDESSLILDRCSVFEVTSSATKSLSVHDDMITNDNNRFVYYILEQKKSSARLKSTSTCIKKESFVLVRRLYFYIQRRQCA